MSFWKNVWAKRPWPLDKIWPKPPPPSPPQEFDSIRLSWDKDGHTWKINVGSNPFWHLPDDPFDPTDWLGGLTEEQIDDALRPINLTNVGPAYKEHG